MRRILQVAVAVLVVAVTATAGIVAAKPGNPPQAGHADTVLRNGFVYTVDDKRSVKQTVALKDGVITYVGNEGGGKRFIGPETEVIDLRGRMLMPGLQDAHVHAQSGGGTFFGCNLHNQALTVPQTLAIVQECLDETRNREPDSFLVVGGFYGEATLPHGTVWHKSMLDTLDTERPVRLNSRDFHHAFVNSRALELAGIDADGPPDPPNGRIDRDENGEPTGWLADAARNLLVSGPNPVPAPPGPSAGMVRRIALDEMNKQGVTTFRDAISSAAALRGWTEVPGGLTMRVFGSPSVSAGAAANNPTGVVNSVRNAAEEFPLSPSVEPTGQIVNVKIFNDGIHLFPGQTGSLLEPYWVNHGTEEEPNWGPGVHNVDPFVPLDVLKNITLRLADEAGVGAHIHAIGDRAVRETLDAFEHVRENVSHDDPVSLSVAHAEMVDPADYGRFAELDVSPVMSFQWGKPGPNMIEALENYIGPERHARAEPIGHLQAAGANVVYGSDWPVDPLDYWHAMQVSMTRMAKPHDEHYRAMGPLGDVPGLTTAEAIEAFTINAARDLLHDSTTGSIEEGKFGDLIVVDRNLFCASPDELAETEVLLTMVGGQPVHGDAESISGLANVNERRCIAELRKEEAKNE